MKPIAIMWFRRDLRLADNPALTAAARHKNTLPLWIDDQAEAGDRAPGSALRVWQYHALQALNDSLGGRLNLRKGSAQTVFEDLTQRFDVQAVYWNRCYEPWRIARDVRIKLWIRDRGIHAESFNGSLLWEPWEIQKTDGTPYRVFTPFYRNGCLAAAPPRKPLARPDLAHVVQDPKADDLSQVLKLPTRPWAQNMMSYWQSGEDAAQAQLRLFMSSGLADYTDGRDFPARPNVSRLSPYLQTGEISPNQVWHAVDGFAMDENTTCFRKEIGWREFPTR